MARITRPGTDSGNRCRNDGRMAFARPLLLGLAMTVLVVTLAGLAGVAVAGNATDTTGEQKADGTVELWDGSTASSEVTTAQSATFEVSIANDYYVREDNLALVEVEITNSGSEDATKAIEWTARGSGDTPFLRTGSFNSTLAAGESETRTVEIDFSEIPAGTEFEFNVDSGDNAATKVLYEGSTDFVLDMDTEYQVEQGDVASLDGTVTNQGEVEGTREIGVEIYGSDGTVVGSDTATETLAGGETAAVTFEWDTAGVTPGSYEFVAAVENSDAVNDGVVHVEAPTAPATFEVEITHDQFPVTAGDAAEVTATVTNTGDESGSQTVGLTVSQGVGTVDETVVDLAAGESRTVTLVWNTSEDDDGSYIVEVASQDDAAEIIGTVESAADAPFVAVTALEANDPIPVGETLQVEGTVVNEGGSATTQEIVLRMVTEDPSSIAEVDSQTVTLDSGEATDVAFSWDSEWGDNPEGVDYFAEIASANDSERQAVDVQEAVEPAEFQVTILGSNAPVAAGETVEVDVQVENVGGTSGTQDVSLAIDGEVVTVESLTLDAGESVTLTFEWETEAAGDATATVSSDDDEETLDLTVHEAPYFEVEIQQVTTAEDGSVTVEATVENRGEVADTQTVTLTSEGAERDSLDVQLDSGESRTVEFSYDPSSEEGDVPFEIATRDSSDDGAITLESGDDSGSSSIINSTVSRLLMLVILALILIGYYVRRRMVDEEEGEGEAGL